MNEYMINLTSKKYISWAIHILFCAVILLIPLFVMSRTGTTDYRMYSSYFVRTTILIVLFYINYLILIDKFLFKKQFVLFLLVNILLITGLVLLQNLILDTLMPPHIEREMRRPGRPGGGGPPPYEMRILSEYILIILAIGMGVALKVTMRWHKDSVNLEKIKSAQFEADLQNLRNQLNPHFLFNTLNNIYALIAIDTQKAQESVHRLSNLLRYISYENDNKFVPLDKELEFTQNYIDLMRLRLNSNVKLNVLIKNEGCKNQIASLMFITLIENAFKHGISNGENNYIDIKILVEKDKGVICTVENSFTDVGENVEAKNPGIGLANLQKRLELLYPNNHRLVVKQDESKFSVLLCINF